MLGTSQFSPVWPLTKPRFVRLEDDSIEWWLDLSEFGAPDHSVQTPTAEEMSGMLDQFLRIRQDKDVVRFARRWGVLGLCEHDLPYNHRGADCQPRERRRKRRWVYHEPIESWLRIARQFGAIVAISADVRSQRPGSKEDWDTASGDLRRPPGAGKVAARDARHVSDWVNHWLWTAGVEPRMSWDGRAAQLQMSADTYGNLVLQLMTAICRGEELNACSGCGDVYLRSGRRAARARRNYCPNCRDHGVPKRDAQRARRARALESSNLTS